MNKLYPLLLGLLLLGAGTAVRSVELQVRSMDDYIAIGDEFDVEVHVTGLEIDDLGGFDFDLAFDPAVLDFRDYALGVDLIDPLFGQQDLSAGEDAPGRVNIAEVSWLVDFTGQPNAFLLATLTFAGITEGVSALTLTRYDLSDGSFPPAAINVNAVIADRVGVPVPGTALLLPLGLGLLGLRRWGRGS